MNSVIILAVIIVALAVIFDFINGFHDTANAIATVVSTRVLSPRAAIIMAAGLNVVGALVSAGVAEAIAKGIVRPEVVSLPVILGGLVGAIVWNLFTWYYGIPSSSSHALVGGFAGAAIAGAGLGAIQLAGFKKILLSFFLSPFAGVVIGFLVMSLLNLLLRNWTRSMVTKVFGKLQILSAAAMAYSHGGNDAQKSMGIIAITLYTAHLIPELHVPAWTKLIAAVAMGLGTSMGGWRIIKTMGHKMVKLEPVHGFAAEAAGAIVIETATHLAMPVSTTHVISSTILSVGLTRGPKAVNWTVIKNIVLAMLFTIPASGLVGAGCYWLVHLIVR
ncbi:MAG TPA: inorganic phosphate transporter [Symbiobacteriaceae bacterium]|nr:inorganic phosphate transporter [Symbiobacteriaceae bacterium]